MKCYIIAEAGVNHNGSADLAIQLIDKAVEAGVDAVKFQTFKADSLVQKGADKAEYQKSHTDDGDQYEMLKKLELSDETHVYLIDYCRQKKVEFLSTGFDEKSIDMLLSLGMQRLKVPSGELTNKPYIEYVAKKNLPMILSTGMADIDEVREAIFWVNDCRIRQGYAGELRDILTILHCTSNYPTPLESVNLNAMKTMADEFSLPVGYSDHTAGILISPMAVAMGAVVIEKHFTLDKNLPGPDHQASLEPLELKKMVKNIRAVEVSLGNGVKVPAESEVEVRKVVRRSVVIANNVKKGQSLTLNDLVLLRPEGEIPPKDIEFVLGKVVIRDMKVGDSLKWSDLEK